MARLLAGCVLIAIAVLAQPQLATAQDGVAHMVFFKLKDASAESKQKLVDACHKYLSQHPGTVHFSAGMRAEDMQRDVNDQAFDVALHVVFVNKEAHDKYQVNERHLKFIEENSDNWDNVRVFDSRVSSPASRRRVRGGEEGVRTRGRMTFPQAGVKFAGIIQVKVVQKGDEQIVVLIEGIGKQWQHSKATDAQSLVGKRVLIRPRVEDGAPAPNLVKFLELLEVGQEVKLDVAHREGATMALLELTEEQRERVKQ